MSAFIIREKTYLLVPLTHQRLPSTGAHTLGLARDVVMILRNRSKCRRPATFVSPLFLVATDRIMRARPCRDRERTRIESFTETSSRRSLTEIQKLRFLLPFLSFPPPVSHRFFSISFLFFFLPFIFYFANA